MSMLLLVGVTQAQQVAKGTRITGKVFDDMGPLTGVNVIEVDETNRNVNHAVTDINGEFTFVLTNPQNRIKVAYVGYDTQLLPFNKTRFNINMRPSTLLKEVVVQSTAKTDGIGLSIPLREKSGAMEKIEGKEFEGLGFTSVDEALQGRISGLDIVVNSGNLGAGTSMRLRGAASISGNSEPLVVVDGNPLSSNQLSDFDFQNANDEKFANLLNVNPDDIESITVMKDAASTAIWGSQGTNGVIEIKTKRGFRGRTRVGYSYKLSGTVQPNGMKVLNGDQYTMLLKESYFNPTLNDLASNIIELNYDPSFSEYQMFNNNTDWISAVKQVGLRHSHTLNLSGGGEKANFRISAGYDNESGSIILQNLNRFTTRLALDYFVSDRITFRTNFNLTVTNNDQNYDGLLGIAYKKMPNLSIYEEDANGVSNGKYYQVPSTISSALDDQKGLVNPLASAEQAVRNSSSLNLSPTFELSYNLLGTTAEKSKLRYDAMVNFGVNNNFDYSFRPSSLSTATWTDGSVNKVSSSASKSQSVAHRHTLTFNPYFSNKKHSFSTLVRAEFNSGNNSSQNNGKSGLPGIPSVNADGTITDFGTNTGENSRMNFATQAHYAYMGKYIVDFTGRLDATTKLGPSKRWKFQPAFSMRWNASDEEFLKDVYWLNMLAVRPSVGISGEEPGGDYLFYSRYGTGPQYNGESSMIPKNIRLSNLHMASVLRYNFGITSAILDNRLNIDFDMYLSQKSDLLQSNKAIPSSSGYSSLSYINNGSLQNKGWDLSINANKVIQKGKNFSMDFNLAFNNNQNILQTLDATILSNYNSEFNRSNGSYLTRVQLNNALGSIYGFKYKGVYQYSDYSETEIPFVSGPSSPVVRNAQGDVVFESDGKAKPMYFTYGTGSAYEFKGGDAIYEDVNHDGNINELDIVYLGSSLPKVNGGFGIKFRIGRLNMNNQFVFRLKQKVVNAARMNAESMYTNQNQCLSVNWRWRVEGDVTTIPRALRNYGYNWLGSDRFVEDASFMRLNYTNFSYSVDSKWLKPIGISSLNLNLSLNNIFVLTSYTGNDPEVGFGGMNVSTDNNQTPRSKSFTAGISANF